MTQTREVSRVVGASPRGRQGRGMAWQPLSGMEPFLLFLHCPAGCDPARALLAHHRPPLGLGYCVRSLAHGQLLDHACPCPWGSCLCSSHCCLLTSSSFAMWSLLCWLNAILWTGDDPPHVPNKKLGEKALVLCQSSRSSDTLPTLFCPQMQSTEQHGLL